MTTTPLPPEAGIPVPPPPPPPPPPPVKEPNWWNRHKVITGFGIVFIAIFAISLVAPKESNKPTIKAITETTTTTDATRSSTTTTEAPTTTTTETPTTTVPPETVSQSNARQTAADYLDYSSFSRTGLIGQLEYEGFSTADATYGVDALDADWNEQAALKAAEYLDYSSFSHAGLVDQLVYEGFSQEQAEYGVSTTGL